MSWRIAVGQLMQESNSFSPLATSVRTFEDYYLRRGAEIFDPQFERAHTEVHGFISVLREAGAVPVPLLAASAFAGGPLTAEAFETLLGEMASRLRAALPVDGVLLALHGALMVGADSRSGDSEIIARLRKVLPPEAPIGVTFDLHGHITPAMLQPNCFHIGYRHYPHIDIYETGERAARLMLDTLGGRRKPVMALVKAPMVVSAACARTSDGPLVPVVVAARAAENSGRALHASLFPVQPWIDVPDLGFAALVCTDGDASGARQVAFELARGAWARRREFTPELVSLEESIRIGLSAPGLTAVSDSGDTPSGGSAADSPAVLRALLASEAQNGSRLVYLSMCDPAAVEAAARAGVGADVTVDLGHYYSKASGAPVRLRASVLALSDGEYAMRDQDMRIGMGRTAVLALGALRILVRALPSFEWDVAMYESQGLALAAAALVFVKSPGGFRHSYGKRAARILVADTPGPTCANLRRVPFTRVTRPLFPLDEACEFAEDAPHA